MRSPLRTQGRELREPRRAVHARWAPSALARAGKLDAVKFGTGCNARWRIPLSRLVPSELYHHLLMVNSGRRSLVTTLAALARKTDPTTQEDVDKVGRLLHEWYQLTRGERRI